MLFPLSFYTIKQTSKAQTLGGFGALDWIRTSGPQSRSYQAVKRKTQWLCGFQPHRTKCTPICKKPQTIDTPTFVAFFQFPENGSQTVVRGPKGRRETLTTVLTTEHFLFSVHPYTSRNLHPLGEDGMIKVCPGIYLAAFIYIHVF